MFYFCVFRAIACSFDVFLAVLGLVWEGGRRLRKAREGCGMLVTAERRNAGEGHRAGGCGRAAGGLVGGLFGGQRRSTRATRTVFLRSTHLCPRVLCRDWIFNATCKTSAVSCLRCNCTSLVPAKTLQNAVRLPIDGPAQNGAKQRQAHPSF